MSSTKKTAPPDGGTVCIAGREFALIPIEEYRALRAGAVEMPGLMPEEEIADRDAARAYLAGKTRRQTFTLPDSIVGEILDAPSPVGPLRRWRGLTQVDLAQKASLAQSHLSQIERGQRGGLPSLKALARALDVPLSLLIDED